MNRLTRILLKNIHRLPGLYAGLCRYAKGTDDYPEQEKYDFICFFAYEKESGEPHFLAYLQRFLPKTAI